VETLFIHIASCERGVLTVMQNLQYPRNYTYPYFFATREPFVLFQDLLLYFF
jgi:hypothetical protein